MTDLNSFVVNGAPLEPPEDLFVRNYLDPTVAHFPIRRPRKGQAVQLVVHETGGASEDPDDVVHLLRDIRNLSVHLICAPDGTLTQHGDLASEVLEHAGSSHNGVSVGIEVMNPYYPSLRPRGSYWTRAIRAKWADKGQYVLPRPEQAETIRHLVEWITSAQAVGLAIPRLWAGLEEDGSFAMNRIPRASRSAPGVRAHTAPGIWAHTYFGHADGAWLVLYAWLRLEAGLTAETAYETATDLAQRTVARTRHGQWGHWIKAEDLPTTSKRLPQDPICIPRELASLSPDRIASCSEPVPTPGRLYRISTADRAGLLALAGRAYGVGSGTERLRFARRINDHPFNRRYWRADLADSMFPHGRISFTPRFACDSAAAAGTKGSCYPLVFIPPRA
jgi:hypothetical protein